MRNRFDDIRIISAASMSVPKTIKIKSSPHHSIVIRLNRKTVYSVGGEHPESVFGDATLIPAGSEYEARPVDKSNEYLIVRFTDSAAHEWELLHTDDVVAARAVHAELCRALVFDDEKSRLRQLSLFYKLLSLLSERGSEECYASPRQLLLIRPALDYIEAHIFSPEFRIGELHAVAGISEVYFRRIFTAHTGMCPQAYVTAKRMERARQLLEEGYRGRVCEVAEAVGYTDALYFSRIYKKHYGHPPSRKGHDIGCAR